MLDARFKSCTASAFAENKSWGRLFSWKWDHHPTHSCIALSVNILLCPSVSASPRWSFPALLQGTAVTSWSVTPAHRRLPHYARSPHTLAESHQQKFFYPYRDDNTNSLTKSHTHTVWAALFAKKSKERSSLVQTGPTFRPTGLCLLCMISCLWLQAIPASGSWSLCLKKPFQRCFPVSFPGRRKSDGDGRMHILGLIWHWQQRHSCPFLIQWPQLVAKASPVLPSNSRTLPWKLMKQVNDHSNRRGKNNYSHK